MIRVTDRSVTVKHDVRPDVRQKCRGADCAAVLACRLRFPVASAFCSCTPSLLSPLHSVSLSPPFDLRELNEDAYAMKAPTTNTLRLDLGLRRFVVVRRPSSSVVVVERRTSNIEHRPSKLRTFLPTSNERTIERIERTNERTSKKNNDVRPPVTPSVSQSVTHPHGLTLYYGRYMTQ